LNYDQSGDWALIVLDESCRDNQQFLVSKGAFIKIGWIKAENFKLEP